MAEVKITITGEDKTTPVFSAVEKAGTSAFDKLKTASASFMSSAKEHWMSISAAGVAAWMAIGKAMDYAKLGASALQAEESFKNVANAYGEDADRLLSKMKEVSKGIIDDSDLMQRAVKGLQQGLSGNQLVSLLEVARSSARVAGIDVASAFDRITEATANQTTRGLKQLGIVIDQTKAFEDHAKKIGTTADALTELQQSQALANAAIEEGQRQMKAMGDITENATEKIQKSEAQLHELKETIGKGLLVGLQMTGGALYIVSAAALVLSASFWKTVEAGTRMLALFTFGDAKKNMLEFAEGARDAANIAYEGAGSSLGKGIEMLKNISIESGKASEGTKGLAKAQQDAAAAASIHAAEQKKLTEAYAKIDDWKAKVEAMNPALKEADKETLALTEDVMKLGREFGNLPGVAKMLSDTFDKGIGFIRQKAAAEVRGLIDDIFINSQKGIGRDLLGNDKWMQDTVLKYRGQGNAILAITQEWSRRRAEIIRSAEQQIQDDMQVTADLILGIKQKTMTDPQKYNSTVDNLYQKQDQAGTKDAAEQIRDLQALRQQWSGMTDEVMDGANVYRTQAQATELATRKVQELGDQIEKLQRDELDKAKTLTIEDQPALDAINEVKSALNSIPDVTYKKVIFENTGTGSDEKPIMDKLREITGGYEGLPKGGKYTANFVGGDGQPIMSSLSDITSLMRFYAGQQQQSAMRSATYASMDFVSQADSRNQGVARAWNNYDENINGMFDKIFGSLFSGQIGGSGGGSGSSGSGSGQPVDDRDVYNISFGDIIVQGATDAAQLAKEIVKPLQIELQRLAAIS